MRFHKSFVFLSLFLILFSSVIAQKIVEDIKPEKQFRKLTNYKDTPVSSALAWSRDGNFIIYARNGEVRKYELNVKKDNALTSFTPFKVKEIRFSPSGKRIAYLIEESLQMKRRIVVEEIFSKKRKVIKMPPTFSHQIYSFIWNPDESEIIFPFMFGDEYQGIGIYYIDKAELRMKKLPYSLGSSIAFSYGSPQFYVVTESQKERLHLLLFDLIKNEQVKKIVINLNLSIPFVEDIDCEGGNILFSAMVSKPLSDKYGYVRQLFKYNLKSSILYILTREQEGVEFGNVRYSPDCKKIAFFSNRDGAWNIWLLNLEEEHK